MTFEPTGCWADTAQWLFVCQQARDYEKIVVKRLVFPLADITHEWFSCQSQNDFSFKKLLFCLTSSTNMRVLVI